jgi:predicted hydrocarbon binding protein
MTIEAVDPERGTAGVRVDHSVYVAEYGHSAGRRVCYMFGSAYAGAMEYVAAAAGHELLLAAEETACAAEGAPCCSFAVAPRRGGA